MSMYKPNCVVKVKPSWKSHIFERYYGSDLRGEIGGIIELHSDGRARVKFLTIKRWNDKNEKVGMEDFVWPFWIKDLESVMQTMKGKRIRRTGRALASKRSTVKRLKVQGLTIKEISEQILSPIDTIKEWLYRKD